MPRTEGGWSVTARPKQPVSMADLVEHMKPIGIGLLVVVARGVNMPLHEFLDTVSLDLIAKEVFKKRGELPVEAERIRILKTCVEHLRAIGFTASAASLERLLSYEPPRMRHLQASLEEFAGRFSDEASETLFFGLTKSEFVRFAHFIAGWEPVVKRFPGVVRDIEEAQKCFVFERYAASVYHSTQAVEVGLIELGKFIGVDDPKSGFTTVNKKVKALTKIERQKMPEELQGYRPFLEQVDATIEALKNAWRNRISHAHNRLQLLSPDFVPEIADEIMSATRSFLRRLAEEMPDSDGKTT